MSDAIDQLFTDAYAAGRNSKDARSGLMMAQHPKHEGVFVAVHLNEAEVASVAEDVQRELDARAPAPTRRKGTHVLADLASFCSFVNRCKDPDSAIYADIDMMSLTCVLNEMPIAPGYPAAWRDHRAVYACPRSPAWLEWTRLDGKQLTQEAFADFIEAHLEHLANVKGYPAPTDLLKMARDLQVLTKGTYKRAINPTTGASILECKSETDTGSTEIPRAFALAIPVFDGGAIYQVEARIRMQMVEGAPRFLYLMHRRTEIERDAFGEVCSMAADQTGLALYKGKA